MEILGSNFNINFGQTLAPGSSLCNTLRIKYGGEYWTKMELNKFISNRVMHYIVPCGDIPSKTTNFSVDRYTIPDTSCYCIGHAPTSYRMLLYRAWCCQIVINVRRQSASHPIKLFPMLLYRLQCATLRGVCQDMLINMPLHRPLCCYIVCSED